MRDDDFIRGNIPMTKSEIRAVSISKMDLRPDDILYDIGAGTGSVSVEAAGYLPRGRVYAFEEKEEGCDLIRANAERFGVENIDIIPGHAPESFRDIPAPDCAFIGGSGGCFEAVVSALITKNPKVRIVANVITLETLTAALEVFGRLSLKAEIVCINVSVAEEAGSVHLMKARNPVYILTVNT